MPQEFNMKNALKFAIQTENHFALIESEYAHMMKMVHETDIDTFVRE